MTVTAASHADPGSRETLLAVLRTAGALFEGSSVYCPFHLDFVGTGVICTAGDGAVRYKCRVCGADGDVFELRERISRECWGPLLDVAANSRCESATSGAQVRPTMGATPSDTARLAPSQPCPQGPLAGLRDRVEQIVRGHWRSIPLPWRRLTELAMPLLPGNVVIFAGTVGASKTFMLIQSLLFWLEMGVEAVALVLEGDKESYLNRALSQLAGLADVTKPAWIVENAARMRELIGTHSKALDQLGHHVYLAKDLGVDNQSQAAGWVERQAKAGRRVIGIDPISLLDRGDKPWVADQWFIKTLKKTAETYGASLWLVSHPQKGTTEPSRVNLAGGAAFERHADAILTLENHEVKSGRVHTDCGTADVEYNRTLRIEKSRHGAGTNVKMAFDFVAGNLTLRELGILVKTKKGARHE